MMEVEEWMVKVRALEDTQDTQKKPTQDEGTEKLKGSLEMPCHVGLARGIQEDAFWTPSFTIK